MKQPLTDRVKEWFRTHIRIPLGVKIAICVLPALLVILYYILRHVRGAMDFVTTFISRPVRGFFSMIYSIYPVSIMEIMCTSAGIFLIYYIIASIRGCARRRDKWKRLGKRALILLVAVLYVFSGWCWLWSTGYYSTGFAEKNGLESHGVDTPELIAVTELFAQGANYLSVLMERDEDGSIVLDRNEMFNQSRGIYKNISARFPELQGRVFRPKPMHFYSWLMTITGYTGLYFAFTGESMINVQQHGAFMPATVAHEHAHQLGVYAEDEAAFVGILACVTSGYPAFEYAGYLSGLNYLLNALAIADDEQWAEIINSLSDEVRLDRAQNSEFWANSASSDTGIDFLDNLLIRLKRTSNNIVDSVYDNYLKSNDQELGLATYGACVDMLVVYFMAESREQ